MQSSIANRRVTFAGNYQMSFFSLKISHVCLDYSVASITKSNENAFTQNTEKGWQVRKQPMTSMQ